MRVRGDRFVYVQLDVLPNCGSRGYVGDIGGVDIREGNVAGYSFRAGDYVLVWDFPGVRVSRGWIDL